MLLSPADQPTTKLSGLFGEIQQKLFLWEFHLLELQHNGQCICNALQKAICTGMFDVHHTLLVSEAILRRRLQCTSVVKLVHSPLLLLNISFCLYWLLHSCNKQYPYKWPAKSPARAPRLWEQQLLCSHSTVFDSFLVNSLVLPPSSQDLDGELQAENGLRLQSPQKVRVSELNKNLFAMRAVWAKIIINPCLRYSPPPSYPANYILYVPSPTF